MSKLIKPSALLKNTWALYREKFALLFSLIFFPCLLLELDPLLNNIDPSFSIMTSGLIVLAAGLLMTWAGIAGVLVLADNNKSLKFSDACQKSWAKFWPLVWVAIIASFVIGGGFALFIIPGLIFSVYFIFAKLIAILENKKGLSALIYSREYLRGHFWAITGRYFLVVFVSLIVYSLLNAIFNFLVSQLNLSSLIETLISSFATVLINALTFPLMMTAMYLLYQNLREVKGELIVTEIDKKAWPYLIISLIGWVWLFVFIFFLATMFMTFLISFLTSSFVTEAIMSTPTTLPN